MTKFGDLRLAWLEAFVQVKDSGYRMAAAAEMGIGPSDLTKHIQKLEQWLGGRMLLWHDSVPARLTEYGETFLPVARQILALANDAHKLPDRVEAPPAPGVSVEGTHYTGPLPGRESIS